ncbi:hypothetical protein AQJ23_14415 [Streptomyces antibioticus]|nr:hypothetical protein [Streptomyces antibioticus]KUN26363.1 hypothetical protein AQJ23_14415 [Streptomyces antibioticus]
MAFNVRGAADAWAERARINTELNGAASGDFSRLDTVWTARDYRVRGARNLVGSLIILLIAFLEAWL